MAEVTPDWRPERTTKPKRRTEQERMAAEVFKHLVCASGNCLAETADCEPPLQCAHVVPKQTLRLRGLSHLIYDPLGAVPLCYYHHRRHDAGVERIPRYLLPADRLAWCEAHDLVDALERYWPADWEGAEASGGTTTDAERLSPESASRVQPGGGTEQ